MCQIVTLMLIHRASENRDRRDRRSETASVLSGDRKSPEHGRGLFLYFLPGNLATVTCQRTYFQNENHWQIETHY